MPPFCLIIFIVLILRGDNNFIMIQNHIQHEYNYGIGIMKLLMAYFVVLLHTVTCNIPIISFLQYTSVPCFMICSFFYTADTIINGDFHAVLLRCRRLLFPFWIWSILYAIKNIFFNQTLTISEIRLHFLCGISNEVNSTFWFFMCQFYLIIILWSVNRLLKKNPTVVAILMLIIASFALLIQYKRTPFFLLYPNTFRDKSVNMLVYAALGLFLNYTIPKIKIKPWKMQLSCAIVFVLVFILFPSDPGHYSAYSGAKLVHQIIIN